MESKLIEVETLKNILISQATNGNASDTEYKKLRERLINEPNLKDLIPRFIFTCRSLNEYWGFIKAKSPTYQGRRDFLRDEFEAILTMLEQSKSSPIDGIVRYSLNADHAHLFINEQWEKGLSRRESDPEGAITIARTMLESTCKFILDMENEDYNEKMDLPTLYKKVQKQLNLAPDGHTEPLFRQILGGCASVIYGLGSIRNKLSDAHGKGIVSYKPSKRHAQMAVNMAGTMADFLISTWKDKNELFKSRLSKN